MANVADQCRDAIVLGLRQLGLKGLEAGEIVARDKPQDWAFLPRGLAVVPDKEMEGPGTNERDDYGYVFGLYWSRGTGKDWDGLASQLSDWRRQVRIKFNNKRFDNVPLVYLVGVRTADYLNDKTWQDNRAISALSVVCWSREARVEA